MSDDRTCRLCLSTEGAMEEIFASPEAELSKKIFECTSVEVKNLVGLPALICEICKSELIIWMKFRRQCLKSNEILKAKFPALFAELQIEQSEAGGSKRHEFEEMSEGDEESRQDDPDYQDEPEDDEDVPLLRFKVERTNDFESEELQQTEDESLGVSERTITMQIEPQDGNERNTGKRRMTRNFTEEMPRMKRKSSGRGEHMVGFGIDPLYCNPKNEPDLTSNSQSMIDIVDKQQQNTSNISDASEIKSMVTQTNQLILRLTDEVTTMRKEFRELKKGLSFNEKEPVWISKLPCRSKEDFANFEKDLQQTEIGEELITLFAQNSGRNPIAFLKNNIRRVMHDEIGQWFCWNGNKKRLSIGNTSFILTLRRAFHKRFPMEGDGAFDKIVKRHYQYAKERVTRKESNRSVK